MVSAGNRWRAVSPHGRGRCCAHICKYVHSTSRGHEAIQLATGFLLKPCDFVSPYYRDESLMLGMGYRPYELMLQLLAKGGDPFTGGRAYYNHPNSRREGQ